MARCAIQSAMKSRLCGSGFQPRFPRGKMPLSQKKKVDSVGSGLRRAAPAYCGTKSPRPPFPKGERHRRPLTPPLAKGVGGILKTTPLEAAENSYRDCVEGLCNDILNHHTFVSQDYSTTHCVQIETL